MTTCGVADFGPAGACFDGVSLVFDHPTMSRPKTRAQEFFISWAPELVSSDIDNTQGKGLFPFGFMIVHDELSPIDSEYARDST